MTADPSDDDEALILKSYVVRKRITRVHHFTVEACDEEEARELASEIDEAESDTDMFDSEEIIDVMEQAP